MLPAMLLALSEVVLSGTFPEGVPSGRAIEHWERLSGHAEYNGRRVAYELLVDPRRNGLYTITRYRLHLAGREQAEDEILIWNARPGMLPRERLRCFARVSRPRPDRVGFWAWDVVPPETLPYIEAMHTAARVYILHRANERELEAAEAAK